MTHRRNARKKLRRRILKYFPDVAPFMLARNIDPEVISWNRFIRVLVQSDPKILRSEDPNGNEQTNNLNQTAGAQTWDTSA